MSDVWLITEDGEAIVDEFGDVLVLDGAPVAPVVPAVRHVTPSRQRAGHLSFFGGGDGGPLFDFSCNQRAVKLVPTFTTGTGVTTICGTKIKPATKTTWTLTGNAVSDFQDEQGFILFAHQYDGYFMAFEWATSPSSALWRGLVRIRALPVGGDVDKRLMVPWSWQLQGPPTRVLVPVGPIG